MASVSHDLDEVQSLLTELAARQVQLSLSADGLAVQGPRGALDESLRARLTASKPAIMALLQGGQHGAPGMSATAVPSADRDAPFPLTDIQQAYWIGRTEFSGRGAVMCHYYQEFESSGLELGRLERAFNRMIVRQEMLRAVVDPDGRQRILPQVPYYSFTCNDMRGHTPGEIEATIGAVRERMAYEVFDAGSWPLYNIHSVVQDEGRIRLHLSFDLIMIDAESLSKLIWDWKSLYDEPEGETKPLDFSFRDYVIAGHMYRDSAGYRQSLAYWDARLDSLPLAPALPQPLRRQEESHPAPRLRQRMTLSRETWTRMKTQAQARRITPSGLLCAMFAEVLGAWSREPRFTMNLTYCDRRLLHPDVGALLGDFTANILLESDTTSGTFEGRARALNTRLQHDMDHARVSGVEVLRRLNRRRQQPGLVTMPVVFTSLLGHRESRPSVLFSGNWLGAAVYGISQTPQVSLDFQAYEEDGGVLVQWDAVEADYPPGVLQDMFAAYRQLAERVAGDQQAWSADRVVTLPEDQARLWAEANATASGFAATLLHVPFEHQAAARPAAPAVIAADRSLSYAQLDLESRALAHRLILLGILPGQHVAVVMEKGWEQVVGVLGILRAGAAYLPIDPELPQARLHHLLVSGEARIAITQPRFVDRLRWPASVQVLPVTPLPDETPMPERIVARQAPGDLAYTIFTSGSTGTPKGVMIDHRGALNTVLDVNQRFGIGPQDRVLALSALNFDLSVYDIFGLLAAGGAIVMPPAAAGRDPEDWTCRIRDHRVTVWNTVPQLMRMLTEYHRDGTPPGLDCLRIVMMSGDWIPPSLPGQIEALIPGARMFSLGGATEASIWSIIYPIEGAVDDLVSVPYGKAMANQTFYVLDQRLQLRPHWAEGELYIGGKGLALGYWRNPQETSHRFVTQPETRERLYRTGDLGRALPDGNIELLGRVDFQVKIQGHRIELGEIEHALKRNAAVREAVVEARRDTTGQMRLVAYVVPRTQAAAELGEMLTADVAAHLPNYMVPAVCMIIHELPLSANGKLDRKRLPEPDWTARETKEPGSAQHPATPGETALLEAVRTVLGLEQVDLNANVFDLGGNSVQMVQINRLLRKTLNRNLPVTEMFNHRTLASYARYLEAAPDLPPRDDVGDTAGSSGRRAALARRRARMATAAD